MAAVPIARQQRVLGGNPQRMRLGGAAAVAVALLLFSSAATPVSAQADDGGSDADGASQAAAGAAGEGAAGEAQPEPIAAAGEEADGAEEQDDQVGTSEVALDGREAVLRTQSANVGSLVADAVRVRAAHLAPGFGVAVPQAAVVNGGGLRNDSVIPPGPLSVDITRDIAAFDDVVVTAEVPRERLLLMLEGALSRWPEAAGSFPHVSGMTVVFDPMGWPAEVDRDGDCEIVPDYAGRVYTVTLDDGTEIVHDGAVVEGDPIAVATLDFLADGGDCYPLADIEFTRLGITYQQALADYIADDLDGVINAEQYPVDGGDRVRAAEFGELMFDYVVQPGDTLRELAWWYLDGSYKWPQIFKANVGRPQPYGGMLTDPDLILVGWTLRLPYRTPGYSYSCGC